MKNLILTATLLSSFQIATAFAGERTLTLLCQEELSTDGGELIAGGGNQLKITLNTNGLVKVLLVRSSSRGDGYLTEETKTKGSAKTQFVSASGSQVFLFRDYCLKSKVKAVILNGQTSVMSCTDIKNDKRIGSDYPYCNQI